MAQPKTRLEYLRKVNFLTQQEVADALGITLSHYHKIERGVRGLSMNMAKKLKPIFHVNSIDELLDEAS